MIKSSRVQSNVSCVSYMHYANQQFSLIHPFQKKHPLYKIHISVNPITDFLNVEKSHTTLTSVPEETIPTSMLTTNIQATKIPKLLPGKIEENMDLNDDTSESEEEDEIIQYLNEKIRILDEQIAVATKDESLDTKKDILLRALRSKRRQYGTDRRLALKRKLTKSTT